MRGERGEILRRDMGSSDATLGAGVMLIGFAALNPSYALLEGLRQREADFAEAGEKFEGHGGEIARH